MIELKNAFNNSLSFAKSHYENFPVIFFTVPKEIRKYIAVVYQFARQADDIADEGNLSNEQRINLLNEYENNFLKSFENKYENEFWYSLKITIEKFNIEKNLFLDLISAFKQDVTKNRYKTESEILDYCRRSANPVGRILLKIFNVENQEAKMASDKICTALQLTNFYQDVSIDIKKNRIYVPESKMNKYNIVENDFYKGTMNDNLIMLFKDLTDETKKLFEEGKVIQNFIPKSFLIQMRMTILGGIKILEKIISNNYDVLNKRPKLNKKDFFEIFIKSLKNV
ncbi:MAG: squalene synthase HpnC [Melioribacteraceae bacterium]|nr:squalene synthase HpnC [Melioribacteraceae bacterium]